MKKLFVLMMAVVITALMSTGAYALSITQSKHNLSAGGGNWIRATSATGSGAEVCVFCHTAHQTVSASQIVPLWNHADTTASFTPYTSSTYQGWQWSYAISGSTKACLSCHDGVTAVNNILNNAGSGAGTAPAMQNLTGTNALPPTLTTYLGTDLSRTHPVSFKFLSTHPDVTAGNLFNPDTTNVPAGWLGGTGTITTKALSYNSAQDHAMECASCHEPHNNVNTMFLRLNNTGSALCLTCHNK